MSSVPLPPGPRMPMPLQTAIWSRKAQWMLRQCAARFGETFTLRILHEGTWIMLSNPDHIRQVFTGDARVFHAGEGNRVLLPVLGEHSVLLLDEGSHLEHRRLLLPPFHGKRMQSYQGLMERVAREEIDRWPHGEPYRLRPRMQALTLEIILRAVFGIEDGERLERLRLALRRVLNLLSDPRVLLLPVLMGPERLSRSPTFQRLLARRRADLRGDRRASPRPQPRPALGHPLAAARGPPPGRSADRRPGTARRACHAARRRTRDDRHRAGVGRPSDWRRHPDKLQRLTRRSALVFRPHILRRGGDRDAAPAARHLTSHPAPDPSRSQIGDWNPPARRGVTVTPSIYLVHRGRDLYPAPSAFSPERFLEEPARDLHMDPVRRRRSGVAWVRRSLEFEMRTVLSELVKRRQFNPSRAEPEPTLRRAITETPRRDAEVILT